MKLLVVLLCVTIYMAVVTCAQEVPASAETDELFREEYCSAQINATKTECSSLRCNKDNTKIIAVPCAEARCSGKPVGFKGDTSKPYPDCCMVPICDESISSS